MAIYYKTETNVLFSIYFKHDKLIHQNIKLTIYLIIKHNIYNKLSTISVNFFIDRNIVYQNILSA